MTGILRSAIGALAMLTIPLSPARAASIPISLTIPPFVQISGLSDVIFASVSLSADATRAQNVCIYSNSVTRAYTVTATGSGSGSSFRLSGLGGATAPYSVSWSGTSGSSGGSALSAGSPSGVFSNAGTTPACAGGTSSTLTVHIRASDLQAMTGGVSYTGALTLLIAAA